MPRKIEIELPDDVYGILERWAALEGISLPDLIVREVEDRRRRPRYPGSAGEPMKVVDASVLVEHLGNALRRRVRTEVISRLEADRALTQLRRMRLQRVLHQHLVDRARELRDNVSFYDALYVALAEELDVPLLTLDRKLASATGLGVEVELVAPV